MLVQFCVDKINGCVNFWQCLKATILSLFLLIQMVDDISVIYDKANDDLVVIATNLEELREILKKLNEQSS